uniref:Uncharacterized protein n=1 Tax=viral metagenome TaxID=1070528 RepID=A0A2V0RM92_9ZZZZ
MESSLERRIEQLRAGLGKLRSDLLEVESTITTLNDAIDAHQSLLSTHTGQIASNTGKLAILDSHGSVEMPAGVSSVFNVGNTNKYRLCNAYWANLAYHSEGLISVTDGLMTVTLTERSGYHWPYNLMAQMELNIQLRCTRTRRV